MLQAHATRTITSIRSVPLHSQVHKQGLDMSDVRPALDVAALQAAAAAHLAAAVADHAAVAAAAAADKLPEPLASLGRCVALG